MDDEQVQQIRTLRREKLKWSAEENCFRNRGKDCRASDSSFSGCADVLFRKSVFGVYLKSFNEKELHSRFLNENKLGITQWDLKSYTEAELIEFTQQNLLTNDLFVLLLKAVKTVEVIDWSYLHNCLLNLRLSNCNVIPNFLYKNSKLIK